MSIVHVFAVSIVALVGESYGQNVAAPTGLKVQSKTATTLTLTWDSVPNTVNYQVYYKRKNSADSWSVVDSGNTSSVTLPGLQAYTVYLAQVLANTTIGASNKSEVTEHRTDEAPPSAVPSITKVISTRSTIYLEWDPIPKDEENGVLLGYRVYYLRKEDIADHLNKIQKINININHRNATIKSLLSFTVYYFGVAAYNSKDVDRGLLSLKNVKFVRTNEGVPSPPNGLKAKFVSNTNLSISWTLLTADQANGIVRDYLYIVFDGNMVKANVSVSNTTDSVMETSLNACREYVIKVTARTGAGTGNYTVLNLGNSCGPPKITHYKPEVVTALHVLAVLPCDFSGVPKPTVKWVLADKTVLHEGHAQKHIIQSARIGVLEKYITAYSNGSLVIDFVETIDAGLYTCIVESSSGNASANTTLKVGEGSVHLRFQVFLTNVSHDAVRDKQSLNYQLLSAQIVNAVRGAFNNTVDFKVRDVKTDTIDIDNNSQQVFTQFQVTSTYKLTQKEHDVIEKIVDILATKTRAGRLGNIAVSNLVIVEIAPPPPTDLSIVRLRPTYVILQWKTPKNAIVYEIDEYSIAYRKFTDKNYKSLKTVKNDGSTIQGIVEGLSAGELYKVRIRSQRQDHFGNQTHRGAEIEIKTPNPMLKTILLIIVLPAVLALIAVLLICFVIRPMVYRKREGVQNIDGLRSGPAHQLQENPYSIASLLQEFPCKWKEIQRTDLLIAGKQLGEGAFGKVIKAEYKMQDKKIPCAVKMLKPNATERDRRDLFNELSIMSQVGYHPNVISLLGACTTNGPMWVVVKLAENGSLLTYLYEHRVPDYLEHSYMNVAGSSKQDTSTEIEPLTKLQKLNFIYGIAKGMSHLEKMKCIHRDLAARNVLLDKHMVPMVSDFGLSRDIYVSGMYEDVKGGKRPVRWMPPEAIEDYTCTSKSDVWSFGVTAWEIETAGTVPYAGFDNGMDILNEIKKGYRLEKPPACDDDVYNVMLSCWRANPLDRPSFKDLTATLEEMLVGISEYLELQPEDEYQEIFLRPYDEIHINTEDIEDMSPNSVPNGDVSNGDNPSGVMSLDNTGTFDEYTML